MAGARSGCLTCSSVKDRECRTQAYSPAEPGLQQAAIRLHAAVALTKSCSAYSLFRPPSASVDGGFLLHSGSLPATDAHSRIIRPSSREVCFGDSSFRADDKKRMTAGVNDVIEPPVRHAGGSLLCVNCQRPIHGRLH